jgi:copper chaperone CopZ
VGKGALEGLKGIKKVETGFKNSKEVNIVQYDSSLISLEEMEEALQRARTYRGTDA